MDMEFHYWITGLIALRAGFSEDESKIIAYSSEFVDENNVSITVKNKENGEDYSNYVSQTMNILKPKAELMRIYPIFHFVPGDPNADSAARRDGKMHLLNTTPNNENARAFLSAAFECADKELRLYRIGIASHSYVDTWAHQNFVGWYDYFNNIGLDIKPDIGHANGEHHPDWISHRWIDNRLVQPEINNKHRFLSAAKGLFNYYCDYLKKESGIDNSKRWDEFQGELVDIMGKTYSGNHKKYEQTRIDRYKEATGFPEFDEQTWFEEAIKVDVHGLPDSRHEFLSSITLFEDEYFWQDSDNYKSTNWFKFQEAVKAHEKYAIEVLQPVFKKMGISLRNT